LSGAEDQSTRGRLTKALTTPVSAALSYISRGPSSL
jgi:hypothetical protein